MWGEGEGGAHGTGGGCSRGVGTVLLSVSVIISAALALPTRVQASGGPELLWDYTTPDGTRMQPKYPSASLLPDGSMAFLLGEGRPGEPWVPLVAYRLDQSGNILWRTWLADEVDVLDGPENDSIVPLVGEPHGSAVPSIEGLLFATAGFGVWRLTPDGEPMWFRGLWGDLRTTISGFTGLFASDPDAIFIGGGPEDDEGVGCVRGIVVKLEGLSNERWHWRFPRRDLATFPRKFLDIGDGRLLIWVSGEAPLSYFGTMRQPCLDGRDRNWLAWLDLGDETHFPDVTEIVRLPPARIEDVALLPGGRIAAIGGWRGPPFFRVLDAETGHMLVDRRYDVDDFPTFPEGAQLVSDMDMEVVGGRIFLFVPYYCEEGYCKGHREGVRPFELAPDGSIRSSFKDLLSRDSMTKVLDAFRWHIVGILPDASAFIPATDDGVYRVPLE